MQGIGGEEHTGQTQLRDQHRHARDLARRPGHLLVGQDERGITGKRAEHVSRFLIVQAIEAAAQRLTIERDDAHPVRPDGPLQPTFRRCGGLQLMFCTDSAMEIRDIAAAWRVRDGGRNG